MAQRSEDVRRELERTRHELGGTVDALGYKANVPARTKGWLGAKRDAVTGAAGSMVSGVTGATDSMVGRVSNATPSGGEVRESAGRVKDTAERNPLGLALAGAAVGFVAGILAPSTRVEDEHLGEAADQVKEAVKETGQEALERGREVAQSAAQSAVETVKEEGRGHAEELAGRHDAPPPDGLA